VAAAGSDCPAEIATVRLPWPDRRTCSDFSHPTVVVNALGCARLDRDRRSRHRDVQLFPGRSVRGHQRPLSL